MTIPSAINVGSQDLADPAVRFQRFRVFQRVAEMGLADLKAALQAGDRSVSRVMTVTMQISDLLVSMLSVQADERCRAIAVAEFGIPGYDVQAQWLATVAAIRAYLDWMVSNWPNSAGNIQFYRWDATRDGSNNMLKLSVSVVSITAPQATAVITQVDAILAQFTS